MSPHRWSLPLAILLACGAAAGGAAATGRGPAPEPAEGPAAELLSTGDVERILDIAEGYGEAELERTQEGEPVIAGDLNGIAYQLFFFECPEAPEEGCEVLNFYAIWDVPFVGLDALNAFNRTNPFHKAYLMEDTLPVLELNLLAPDGVTTVEQVDAAYARYTVALAAFQAEVVSATP